ncbi:chemokine XC receptor 1 isoform X2 [Gouania willdenowi]|nr:chemokine XC receptor 1-like isoform X2 [Gouania willdenowi]
MASTTFSMDPDTPTTAATIDSTALYDYNYEDEICNKENIQMFGAIFTPLFFSAIVILSLFGNILVLVILVKYENLKLLTNTLLLNLVVSDLLFTAGLPFWAYAHVHRWTFGEHACKVVNFIFNTGYYSSGFLLIIMTAHRYMAVMYPLSDVVSTAGFYSVVASVVLWVGSVLAASPNMIFITVHDNDFCGYDSSSWNLFDIYMQNLLFLLTSWVFISCYAQIICRLLRSNAKRRGKKTLKLIFTLLLVFFVGWAPYNVIIFQKSCEYWKQKVKNPDSMKEDCDRSKRLDYSLYVGRLFAFSQCCLNPVLYVFVGVKFKSHLRKLLSFKHPNNSVIRNRQSRLTITSITSGEEV